jgi:protein TonB
MKTLNQHNNSENVITMEDIIFAGRNQEYGAFMLRKKSNKYVIQSFLITFAFLIPLFLVAYFNKGKEPKKIETDFTIPIKFEKVDKQTFVPPPPPAMPDNFKNILQNSNSGYIEVVDTIMDPQDYKFMLIEEIVAANPGITKVEYIDTSKNEDLGIPNPNTVHIRVEEEAIFKGGTIKDFCKWVGENLKYPQKAIEMNLQGKVTVKFVVNTEGKTESIEVLRGVDESLDNEACRVIASSPKWRPARQQGYKVKQQFVVPIYFQLESK